MVTTQPLPLSLYKVRLHVCNTRNHCDVVLPVKPVFDTVPDDFVRLIGENVTFSCDVFGIPTPSLSWLKDGQPLDTTTPTTSVVFNATDYINSSRLTLSSLTFNDSGEYSCSASNDLVSVESDVSSNGTLTVNSKSF